MLKFWNLIPMFPLWLLVAIFSELFKKYTFSSQTKFKLGYLTIIRQTYCFFLTYRYHYVIKLSFSEYKSIVVCSSNFIKGV